MDTFLNDSSSDAYEKLIDRLLASPHFGERWARHWLDVARFGESHGFEHDYDRKYAYHYRDFVIKAFNQDMPFDQFVKWQLAGDELDPNNNLALMATGFLGAGVFPTQITANEVERARYDALDDMAGTTSLAMLGINLGCARCHDHKYDPITSQEYYRFVSTFSTTVRSEIELDLGQLDDQKTDDKSNPHLTKVQVTTEGLKPMRHHTQGADFFEKTYYLKRGDPDQKGQLVTQSFLQVLMRSPDKEKHWQVKPPPNWRTSYRRTALANWITDTQYGSGHLLARVIVNRLWQHHMGTGIVATPNDFGAQGQRPTHPQLLDWLAQQLIKNDWRLKPIHKLIMTSRVYQLSTSNNPDHEKIDPQNALHWRRQRQRLEAEIIRDNLFSVSGMIDKRMFGPGTLDSNSRRRSIYFTVKRSRLIPMMQLFDAPDALISQADRSRTIIAPQALMFMNNHQVRQAAQHLAKRLNPKKSLTDKQAIHQAYLIALTRPPTPQELNDAARFINNQKDSYKMQNKTNPSHLARSDFCQVLMSLNEFIYIE